MRSVFNAAMIVAVMGLWILLAQIGNAQPLAFPGAEGYGSSATGGRGGEVIYVANLNDSGPGSLRAAVETKGPRIVVFSVSGTIVLKSELEIKHGNLTLAGQSAPGGGITIKDYPVKVDADNVIIRYMRFRLGDTHELQDDAIEGRGIKNFILDHCSISWGVDEAASFYTNENVTLQWNIISESLNYSAHEKGDHGYGGIWGAVRGSFHHNLIAHHTSRNPRFSGSKYESDIPNRQVDFRNNVIFNWGDNSIYGGEEGEHNIVQNYFKPGPATQENVADRIVNPSRPYGKFYVSGNYVEGSPEITKNNWAGGVQCEHPDSTFQTSPFKHAPVTEHEPKVAFEKVLKYAGASLQRDPVDSRVVREVRTGTARYHGIHSQKAGIIDSQEDVGGWPQLTSMPAPTDTDRDGMPDEWEEKHGLDATDGSDGKKRKFHENYTNVEVYLNELVNPGSSAVQQVKSDYFKPVPAFFYEGLSFDLPEIPVPELPDYSVSIEKFGAVPDGSTLNTNAIRKTIEHVAGQGGGHVVIPRGIWKTGPIVLKSNINLHVKKGALVIFSGDKDLYPLVNTSFEGLDTWRAISPIYGKGLQNVAITGKGIFDGSGHTWRGVNKSDLNEHQWEKQMALGGVISEDGETWYPSEEYRLSHQKFDSNVPANLETKEDHKPYKDFLRPVMVSIRESKNVLFDGPTFQNSPAWMLHPLMSENVIIRNLTVRNPEYSWNGDGIDLESSRNAVIYNNSFDVGDDAICIKSGKNEDGRRRGMPAENVIIRENTVYKAHGGFVVGSEMSGGVRNISVSDMNFIGTDTDIRFKSTRGRGGVVENIDIRNIYMQDIVTEPIRFNLYYGGEAPSPEKDIAIVDKKAISMQLPEVTKETPQFRNIRIRNIFSYNSGAALWIQGLPEMNVQNISIQNVEIISDQGGIIMDADQISMKNVNLQVNKGPILYLNNVHNLNFEEVVLGYGELSQAGTGIRVVGPFTEAIDLMDVSFTNTNENLSIGPNVPKTAIME